MSESRRRLVQILVVLLCVVFLGLALSTRQRSLLPAITEASGLKSASFRSPQSAIRNDLPEGPGADIAKQSCRACHEADMIVQQRLSLAAWSREVEKMVRWGAEVSPEQKERLVAYLASHFKARKKPSPPTELVNDSGVAITRNACTTCHEADMIVQQRLGKAAWTREVDKMIRWGAEVKGDDREQLIEYLAKHYQALVP